MPYRNQEILLYRAPHIKTSGHSSDQLTLLHFLDKKKKKKGMREWHFHSY